MREIQVVSNIYKPYTSHRSEDMFTTGFFPSKTMVKATRKSPSSAKLRKSGFVDATGGRIAATVQPLRGSHELSQRLFPGSAKGHTGPCCGCCRVPSGNDYLFAIENGDFYSGFSHEQW